MNAVVSPVHTTTIADKEVRFFAAPHGRLELPWQALDDLYEAMRFPDDLKQKMLRQAREFPGGDVETVATATGPVVIQSHPMAQGIIGAAIEAGGLSVSFENEYAEAAAAAIDAMTCGLPITERFQWAMQAARNTIGVEASNHDEG